MEEFFARLMEHKLVQWTLGYVAVSFALIPVLDIIASRFGWSQTTVRCLIIALGTGFFLMLVIAWYHGERGEPRITRTEHALLAILVVLGGLAMWRIGPSHAVALAAIRKVTTGPEVTTSPAISAAFAPPPDSLVVLPFANLGNDPKQRYFSDGITEELTNALGQNTALRVIAWDTASKFRDTEQTASEMGKTLNVANLLHGSIEREGDQVRVTAELVNTITGYQVWSQHYDDSLKNIFAVQDHISEAIADALQVKFAGAQAVPTTSPQAHEFYLKGLAAVDSATAATVEAALKDFQQAIALDPHYADAWAELASTYIVLTDVSTLLLKEALPKARAAAKKALALDPHNVNALVALGVSDVSDNRIAQAKAEFQQALALDPSNAKAHVAYGLVLPLKLALAQELAGASLDPQSASAWANISAANLDLGDWPQMLAASQALIKLSPHDTDAAFYLAFAYAQLNRVQDAAAAFDQVKPATALDQQLVDAGRLTYQSLLKPALRPQAMAALDKLRRAKLSPSSHGDLMQLYLALDDTEPVLQMLPGNCANDPFSCIDLAISPLWQPLHGNPRFEKLAKQYTTLTLE